MTNFGKMHLHDDVIYFVANTCLIYRSLVSRGLDALCGQNITICPGHGLPVLIWLKARTLKQGRTAWTRRVRSVAPLALSSIF